MMFDTDPQATAFEMLEPISSVGTIKHLPVGDRYDGANMSTLDGMLRRNSADDNSITIIDTGAGKLGGFADGDAMRYAIATNLYILDRFATNDRLHQRDYERKDEQSIITSWLLCEPGIAASAQFFPDS